MWEKYVTLVRRVLLPGITGATFAFLVGCASPGAPLPPSLNLAPPVTDLAARRVGGRVMLHWTTPARTTDRLLIRGTLTAQICREPMDSAARTAAPVQSTSRQAKATCNVVERTQVSPGESEAADTLPAPLTAGTPRVLAYRVQLLNAAGRTAGPSTVAYAASGAAPQPVTGLTGSSTKPGVVLEWTHAAEPGDSVELSRTLASLPPGAADAKKKTKRPEGLLPSTEASTGDGRFSAKDTGGAIDRTAQAGTTYRYTVERVRQVPFEGKTLEIHGEPSAPVEVAVLSSFPPDTPGGLVAAPAFSPENNRAVIDLSWEPNVEVHVAGYKVYRAQADGGWQLLTTAPVKVAAYRDATVTAGERYRYHVTAVSDAGLESQPSGEISEMAPNP